METQDAALPYLDATEAEFRRALGDAATALQMARKALEQLSADGEKLLRARVAVAACMRLGDTEAACGYFETVLRDVPSVLRLLDTAIPVRITADAMCDPNVLPTNCDNRPGLWTATTALRESCNNATTGCTFDS